MPNSLEQASFGPVVFLLGIVGSLALAWLLVRIFYHGRLRRALPWTCGFPWGTARMQDTAEGLGQPRQPEIADLELLAGDGEAFAVDDAAGADMLGGIDEDIDAGREFAGALID